jgi:hypothetical protein
MTLSESATADRSMPVALVARWGKVCASKKAAALSMLRQGCGVAIELSSPSGHCCRTVCDLFVELVTTQLLSETEVRSESGTKVRSQLQSEVLSVTRIYPACHILNTSGTDAMDSATTQQKGTGPRGCDDDQVCRTDATEEGIAATEGQVTIPVVETRCNSSTAGNNEEFINRFLDILDRCAAAHRAAISDTSSLG